MSDSIERLLTKAYSATHKLLKDQELRSVVRHGFLISYGPPIPEPDLLLLTFQGGGKSPVENRRWPNRLLYLDGRFKFGPALRKLCCATGLYTTLESSAMAFPVVFPQAPTSEAGRWERQTGPYATWRRHSVRWVKRLVDAIKPKVVIVFGDRASRALEMNWEQGGAHPFTAPSDIWAVHVSGISRRLLPSPVSGLPYVGGPEVLQVCQETYLGPQIV